MAEPEIETMEQETTVHRIRTLTEKGQDAFEERLHEMSMKLMNISKDIDHCYKAKGDLEKCKQTIMSLYEQYTELSIELKKFLRDTRTQESLNEETAHKIIANSVKMKVYSILEEIEQELMERRSNKSFHSSVQSSALSQKTKLETARVSLAYAEKELKLKQDQALLEENEKIMKAKSDRQKKEIETNLELLEKKKQLEISEIECKGEQDTLNSRQSTPEVEPEQFQEKYLPTPYHEKQMPLFDIRSRENKQRDPIHQSVLNPEVEPFVPSDNYKQLSNFLLKKDLSLHRFMTFDDKPENFPIWKSSFQAITREICVKPNEEFDLLIKYLGPESRQYAVNIRAANPNNPLKGLERVWKRLKERYGSPEMIDASLRKKLDAFPKIDNKNFQKLYDLSDILSEIESIMDNPEYKDLLSFMNTSSGLNPIVQKLPGFLQSKWTYRASEYSKVNKATYPPFSFFVEFIQDNSSILNNPSFQYNPPLDQTQKNPVKKTVFNKKTGVTPPQSCFIHNSDSHSINNCRQFKRKPISERMQLLKENKYCFKCCGSTTHIAKNCNAEVKCLHCNSENHPSALHPVDQQFTSKNTSTASNQGGESIQAKCTQICGDQNFFGRSCSKTVLCSVHSIYNPSKTLQVYVMIDDQSNRTLVKPELFDILNLKDEPIQYELTSCAGKSTVSGRQGFNLVIDAIDNSASFTVPTVIECDELPNNRHEIPHPSMLKHHKHLSHLSKEIPKIREDAQIMILLGRDVPEVHHIYDQITGPVGSPFAQKLPLGWVVVGDLCLSKMHRPNTVKVMKTYVQQNGRPSIFLPCENSFYVGEDVFHTTKADDKIGLSKEDREFLKLMDSEFKMHADGKWSAPLPFREQRLTLPNNYKQALNRALSLEKSLKRHPEKQEHFKIFMQTMLEKGFAEVAPPIKSNEERWYLPIFGVYHPKKPSKIRVVYDSSCRFQGLSLNEILFQGPNLTNSLLGVLIRFREYPVAVAADIEQMFYCFKVKENHLNFLRFLWYKDNDLKKGLIEYRMTVHVFGNSPSPSIATYGLRKAVENAEQKVKDFVNDNFYVDDGMTSVKAPNDAINLLRDTQRTLEQNGHIRLHKIASNSKEVMNAFPQDDLSKELLEIDLWSDDILPMQRTLGLRWDLNNDTFTFEVSSNVKPYTRRGVLSTINSLYDPLGFIAPVVLRGRIIQRQLTESSLDWDMPLPNDLHSIWEKWRNSLSDLSHVEIPRVCIPKHLIQDNTLARTEVHVFSDASELAIASVAYLRTIDKDGNCFLGFLMGKSKVAPSHCTTISRLELCAAVLASELFSAVTSQLSINIDQVKFYTDSKVVLGYINNRKRRFYTYVTNRVERILKYSSPSQWNFIPTDQNPADSGTRYVSVDHMQFDLWLNGPSFLTKEVQNEKERLPCSYELVNPEDDKEIRPNVSTQATCITQFASLETKRFESFSNWQTLVCAIAFLKRVARSKCKSDDVLAPESRLDSFKQTEVFILRLVQEESYKQEIGCLKAGNPISKQSSLRKLDPFLDNSDILRVGGRLRKANVCESEKHPIIVPGRSHIASLIIHHIHTKVFHQGRHITEGAIRSSGYWLVGGKSAISSFIYKCVTCMKHRGKLSIQKMADLPSDRLTPGPPFSAVGVDAFGPFEVVARKTRGGQANCKRWGILFTCLTTRAIHIEVVESMSSSSFINALRRFMAIRGKVTLFRSDRGTNFVGATEGMKIDAINIEDKQIDQFLFNQGTVWKFNPPHASHMGGAWERLIGVVRRILDVMLSNVSGRYLTHEVFVTFMSEVMAIVNARPLTAVSNDPEMPMVLSPSILLTQKTEVDMSEIDIDQKNMYNVHWKRVQLLADLFWKRWSKEYLQTLQSRGKWFNDKPNLSCGDIVLVRDKSMHRNNWPLGRVVQAFEDDDGRVRKVEIEIVKNNKLSRYIRPCTELVLLLNDV